MDLLILGGIAVAGLILGSFLNVLIYRRQNLIIVLSTSILLVLMWRFYGCQVEFFSVVFLFSLLITAAVIDYEQYIIPNSVILVGLIGAGIIQVFLFQGHQMVNAGLGALSAAGFLFLLRVISRGGVGAGDIKLALVIGLFLGWPVGLFSMFLACLIAGVIGIGLLLSGKKTRKDIIPFGPFLAISAMLSYFKGEEWLSWYLAWLGI
ncbi:MAG: prepilin peptidase [Syntrophomonadaceae bacterium]|nr:prepilin peptidase [Syntrophomonadaceae bacterium]